MKRKVIENLAPVSVKKLRAPVIENTVKTTKSKHTKTLKDLPETKPKREDSKRVPSTICTDVQSQESNSESSAAEEEIEDQTEALLTGFQSDEDEDDKIDKDTSHSNQGKSLRKGGTEKPSNSLSRVKDTSAPVKSGVLYVGRIPHGFFEHEMRDYFSQFGTILQLRLSRNRKTGASKHHAWIKFESAAVAEIVAKTMDNYLMFGHLLKVKIVSDDKIPENLFKGANKRFKKIPWNKLEGRKIKQPRSQDVWHKRIEREQKRRLDKSARLKDYGYEFESPKIKSVDQIVRDVTIANEKGDTRPSEVLVEKPTSKSKRKDSKKD